jgi:hypothetical protein
MKKHYYIAIAFLLPLLFCQHPNSPAPTPDTDQPGYFSLTQLQGLQKTVATTATGTNTIDLGDLHSTTNYYFLLTNSGGHCITNIHLSVSDTSFIIYPTSIDSLTVGLGTQSMVPIVKLTAVHGIGAQGLGNAPLMSPGIHQVQINVTGTTKHNNTDTNTSLIVTAQVNALIMDIDMHTDKMNIDVGGYTSTSGGIRLDGYYIVSLPLYFTQDSADSIIHIINTGNVILNIKSFGFYGDGSLADSSSYLLNISDSTIFIKPPNEYLAFQLNSNNTIGDPNRFQPQSNGKAYFLIY